MTSCRASTYFVSQVEVALDVAQAEEGLRANVSESWHAREADFDRNGDVALDLLGAPARRLRDDFDQRRHRVRVRLDVQATVREGATAHEDERAHQDERPHAQDEVDEARKHAPNS